MSLGSARICYSRCGVDADKHIASLVDRLGSPVIADTYTAQHRDRCFPGIRQRCLLLLSGLRGGFGFGCLPWRLRVLLLLRCMHTIN